MDQAIRDFSISYGTVSSLSDEDHTLDLENRPCKRRGCKARPLDDAEFCARHDAADRRYKRDYDKRRRAEWAAAERCMRCGAKDRAKNRPWCPGCAIRLDRARKGLKLDHTRDLENKRARIAKRLIAWQDSPHNEGRVRLRGGKKGAPSMEERDRQDLRHLRLVLDDYEEALNRAYAPDVLELHRTVQERARASAHAGLALAVRLGMEALQTYGYELPEIAPADSDEDDSD